jgi:hypothetical protein
MLELQDGERIKILISGDPKFSPINFDVVDNESIAICSDKEARRAVQVRAIRGVVKNQKSECASSYGSG